MFTMQKKTAFSLLLTIFFELLITRTPNNSNYFRFPLKVWISGSWPSNIQCYFWKIQDDGWLTSPLHRICDDFATNFSCSYQFIYLQALFNRKIHESRMYRTCRVLATNVVTLRHIGDCIRCNFVPWAWLDYYGVVAANTSEEIYDNDLEFASEEIFYRQKSWIVCSTQS